MKYHKIFDTIKICVDCGGSLMLEDRCFICKSCQRSYLCNHEGVWDFRSSSEINTLPLIFKEAEFQRWLRIFREVESKSWYIYKNAMFRFFSEAGHRKLGKLITASNTKNQPILEIGAGVGNLLKYIDSENYVGVDLSMEGLALLKKKYKKATVICASCDSLPFEKKSFSTVLSLHTLEHLYFIGEFLQEVNSILNAKGKFYYGIPTEGGLGFFLGRVLLTGRHLKKSYDLDVHYVMDREHINDAPRVLKFLRMYYGEVSKRYWPFSLLRFLSPNALIYGVCSKPQC